ncbi:MAG: hypothetical protein IT428_33605 [Planctomycetaceae bacterium]|nr:hypothetical protein [Planctomycetaceae bacterium]
MSEIRAEVTIDRPLAQCTDQESTRYALSAVQIVPSSEKGKVWAAACDSRILALTKQEGRTDGPHLLPGQFAKPNGKGKTFASLNGQWTVSGKNAKGIPDGKPARLAPETEGRFPRTEDVVPECNGGDMVIGIDAALLANLATAIGDNGKVELIIRGPNDAIAVMGTHGIGVAMPVSVNGQHETYSAAAARVRGEYNAMREAYRNDVTDDRLGTLGTRAMIAASTPAAVEPVAPPEVIADPIPAVVETVAPVELPPVAEEPIEVWF